MNFFEKKFKKYKHKFLNKWNEKKKRDAIIEVIIEKDKPKSFM